MLNAAIESSPPPWQLPRGAPDLPAVASDGGRQGRAGTIGNQRQQRSSSAGADRNGSHRGPTQPPLPTYSQASLEAAAFGYLEHHLPGFSVDNWVSKYRNRFYPLDVPPDNSGGGSGSGGGGGGGTAQSLGYAFEYVDYSGQFVSAAETVEGDGSTSIGADDQLAGGNQNADEGSSSGGSADGSWRGGVRLLIGVKGPDDGCVC